MSTPAPKHIVLAGGGHTHVLVLKSFLMSPPPGVRLTLVAKEIEAPYSGMLPGLVAGHYTHGQCHIDVARLARRAGAALIHGSVSGLDRAARAVQIGGHEPIPYDLLSLNLGITPDLAGIEGAEQHALIVKPVSEFAPKWAALEQRAGQTGLPRHAVVIGGGAAGFELALAIGYRLGAIARETGRSASGITVTLVAGDALLSGHAARARTLARQALEEAGIALLEGEPVTGVGPDHVTLAGGRRLKADAAIIATRAKAPEWLSSTGLALDERGYLALRPTLQTLDDDDIFGAGDCATVLDHPRPKAGVFAVRQAMPLANNLRLRVRGEPASPFVPQRDFLALLSLGKKSAIASKWQLAAAGRWAWIWKDHIDRRFMRGLAVEETATS